MAQAAIAPLAPATKLALVEAIAKIPSGHLVVGKEPDSVVRQRTEFSQIFIPLFQCRRHQQREMVPLWMCPHMFTQAAHRIDQPLHMGQAIAEDHFVGLDNPVIDTVALAVTAGSRHFATAAGRIVKGDGMDLHAAGTAHVDAVTGLQSPGKRDHDLLKPGQPLKHLLLAGQERMIISLIQ